MRLVARARGRLKGLKRIAGCADFRGWHSEPAPRALIQHVLGGLVLPVVPLLGQCAIYLDLQHVGRFPLAGSLRQLQREVDAGSLPGQWLVVAQ